MLFNWFENSLVAAAAAELVEFVATFPLEAVLAAVPVAIAAASLLILAVAADSEAAMEVEGTDGDIAVTAVTASEVVL